MSTLPDGDLDTAFAWARTYVSHGWPTFVLGRDKTPVPLCDACRTAGPEHDRRACTCLTCHGFYAATLDLDRVARMIALHPAGQLAVATGRVSDLVVIDAESHAGEEGITGLEVLDTWETWVGGWSLPTTLRAWTESGGLHLFYRYSSVERLTGRPVRQKIRPLPALDVKGDGGYVAVPNGLNHRRWADGPPDPARVASATPELARWLIESPGARWSAGGGLGPGGEAPSGYDFARCWNDGPAPGMRDHFFNDAIFRLRRRGYDRHRVTDELREVWLRTPRVGGASGDFPWRWVEYKIERVFATVSDSNLSDTRASWVRRVRAADGVADGASDGEASAPRSASPLATDERAGPRVRRVGRRFILDPRDGTVR